MYLVPCCPIAGPQGQSVPLCLKFKLLRLSRSTVEVGLPLTSTVLPLVEPLQHTLFPAATSPDFKAKVRLFAKKHMPCFSLLLRCLINPVLVHHAFHAIARL
jgi:hypothetical protein